MRSYKAHFGKENTLGSHCRSIGRVREHSRRLSSPAHCHSDPAVAPFRLELLGTASVLFIAESAAHRQRARQIVLDGPHRRAYNLTLTVLAKDTDVKAPGPQEGRQAWKMQPNDKVSFLFFLNPTPTNTRGLGLLGESATTKEAPELRGVGCEQRSEDRQIQVQECEASVLMDGR